MLDGVLLKTTLLEALTEGLLVCSGRLRVLIPAFGLYIFDFEDLECSIPITKEEIKYYNRKGKDKFKKHLQKYCS